MYAYLTNIIPSMTQLKQNIGELKNYIEPIDACYLLAYKNLIFKKNTSANQNSACIFYSSGRTEGERSSFTNLGAQSLDNQAINLT